MRLLLLTLLGSVSFASGASAQTAGRWVVVPSTVGADTEWAEPAVERVRRALESQGAEVWPSAEAAQRFEEEGSAPSVGLSAAELERWESLSGGAVNDLAEGDYQKALEKLNAAQDISRASIEELNRDPERARRVFDTCLYVVRATLATESESRARSVARECRRLVPRAEPSPYMHPPAVTDLLDQIDALQAKQSGELRLDSIPSGCPARLNGVLLGETPVSIGDVFPGEYRVQVECDPSARGRVHFVTVGAGRAERRVDARFDTVVRSRPSPQLRYPTPADAARHARADARTVAREVKAGSVVLLSMKDGALDLERIDPRDADAAPLALARVAARKGEPSNADLSSAAAALVAGDCTDFTSGKPTFLECGRAPVAAAASAPVASDRPEGRRPRGQFITGMTLVGVGIAGLGVGYGLVVPRWNAGIDWVDTVDADSQSQASQASDTSAQQKWLNLRSGILASGSIGSAALIAAMPLALPEKPKTPWWAWVAGAGGLGLAAFSIAYGVTAEPEPAASCTAATVDTQVPRDCIDRGRQIDVSILTGLTAAPLITMPLVYLFRPKSTRIEPQARLGRGLAYFGVRGRF